MLFEPIQHESVAEAVIHQIENLIVSGVLREGQKLPPEREMAELFDVSRPKLREALHILEGRKLIRAQQGEGTFVAPLVGTAMSDALMDLYTRHTSAFYDYLEYRREQEGFAARLAAERATTADQEIIEQLMSQMTIAQERNDEARIRALDINFHSAVVDASHNATLIHMMSSIYNLTERGVFYNRDMLHTLDSSGQLLLQQHLDIGQAILDGDVRKACGAAHAHLDFVERSFNEGEHVKRRKLFAEKRMLLQNPSPPTAV